MEKIFIFVFLASVIGATGIYLRPGSSGNVARIQSVNLKSHEALILSCGGDDITMTEKKVTINDTEPPYKPEVLVNAYLRIHRCFRSHWR